MATRDPEQINGVPVPVQADLATLLRLAVETGPQCWAAFEALSRKVDPQTLRFLQDSCKSEEWTIRRAACESLGRRSDGRKATLELIALLGDQSPRVVRSAIEACERLLIEQSHDRICRLLDDGEDYTRQIAATALDSLWNPSDFERLAKVMISDTAKGVRVAAARTLRAHVSAENWRSLFQVWKSDEYDHHRIWACELADQYGSDQVLQELHALAQDQNGHVRNRASAILKRMSVE